MSAMTRRVMAPIDYITSPEKPFGSVGESINLLGPILILVKASHNSMLANKDYSSYPVGDL